MREIFRIGKLIFFLLNFLWNHKYYLHVLVPTKVKESIHNIYMKDGLPIWLILEDDAHFTPNFKMKLDAILKILPLDFHICQIGYSRPRNALLKDYGKSNLISIPSFTFFLTGKRKKESTFFSHASI